MGDLEGVTAHRLRRVRTGHGFGMAATDDVMSNSVYVDLYPQGYGDEHRFSASLSPDQARTLARALLDSADQADAQDIP